MLVMTGIVVGQQPDSNLFRSTAYRQDPSTNFQGSGDLAEQANPSDIKPFDLSVTDEQIQGIRDGGGLLSNIEPRDPTTGKRLPLRVISSITLVHENNLNRQLPTRNLYGMDAGTGKIEFELDDLALRELQTSKLMFEIPEADRGRFSQVAFYYRAPASNPAQATGFGSSTGGPSSNDGSGSNPLTFGQPPQDSFGLLPLPGPEAVPGDVEFVGPVMPTSNQQLADANWSGGRNFGSVTPTNQVPDSNQATGWTIPQTSPRQETLAEYQNRIRMETLKQEQIAADLKQQEMARMQRANDSRLSQFGTGGWPDPNQAGQTGPGSSVLVQPSLSEQQITDRLAFLQRQQEIKAYEQNLALREAELAKQKKEIEYQKFVDSLRVNPNNDSITRFPTQTGPVPATNYQPVGPVLEQPARYASNSTDNNFGNAVLPTGQTPQSRQVDNSVKPLPAGGVGKFVASIPAGNGVGAVDLKQNIGNDNGLTQQKKEKRSEGFVYFMLLCSLGLNIYLGLISRGFYVRYNELADELRETFTATM